MPLNDSEYRQLASELLSIFKNNSRVRSDSDLSVSRGSWGRETGTFNVSFAHDTPKHLRFLTEVTLNELRRHGFVITMINSSGVGLQHESCHDPDRYSEVYED